MTSAALTFGSFLLAFSPSLALLFMLVFQKHQLVILAVTSAFAYLLSALFSSLFWLPVPSSIRQENGISALLALAIPSVICQTTIRCLFVKLYFRVEGVIRRSVAKHEEETAEAARVAAQRAQSRQSSRQSSNASNGNSNGNSEQINDANLHAETNALQLQLNDLSCSLASGCGYALLHSLFLYGTLLASESGENSIGGTLYQPSCSLLPSLMHGALIACMFSVLDVMWMMLTFFGMRRRYMHGPNNGISSYNGGRRTISSRISSLWSEFRLQPFLEGLTFYKGLPDSLSGGNAALGLVAISHLLASLVLAPNGLMEEDGCRISLPCLGGVLILVGVLFGKGLKGHFLPEDQRRRIQGLVMMGDSAVASNARGAEGYHIE